MPAKKFICPDGQEIEITRCLKKVSIQSEVYVFTDTSGSGSFT